MGNTTADLETILSALSLSEEEKQYVPDFWDRILSLADMLEMQLSEDPDENSQYCQVFQIRLHALEVPIQAVGKELQQEHGKGEEYQEQEGKDWFMLSAILDTLTQIGACVEQLKGIDPESDEGREIARAMLLRIKICVGLITQSLTIDQARTILLERGLA